MNQAREGKALRVWVLACMLVLAVAAAGCAPQQTSERADGAPETNDTAVKGEYQPFDPSVEAANTSGKAIEGSEEEELQQERIAGGAVGAVTSQNLDEIEGIVDYGDGDYVPNYGMVGEPPAIGHGDNGSDCLSCHNGSSSGAHQPSSHEGQNLGNEECAVCHNSLPRRERPARPEGSLAPPIPFRRPPIIKECASWDPRRACRGR